MMIRQGKGIWWLMMKKAFSRSRERHENGCGCECVSRGDKKRDLFCLFLSLCVLHI